MNFRNHSAPVLLLGTLLSVPTLAASPARLKVAPVMPMGAALFPLGDVRLLDSPFRQAQETDKAYLLRLDPDRLMSHMRTNAGLKPKAASYGGWDKDGAGSVGHYLSACAQMAQATGNAKVRQRVDYVVAEMVACQRAKGDGGLYAFAWDADTWFPKLAAGEVIPVPVTAWYSAHKILAGLRDAWLLCGSIPARDALVRMGDWCITVTARL